jgi:hypothetical protein
MQEIVTIGDFTLQIYTPHGYAKLIPNSYAAFFQLYDNSEYSIVLKNNGPTKCDASIDIDGENIGNWRLEAGLSGLINHPMSNKRKFVFKNADNFEYKEELKNGQIEYPANGKISVTFKPEIKTLQNTKSLQTSSYIPQNNNILNGKQGSSLDLDRSKFRAGSTVLGDIINTNDPLPVYGIQAIDHARVTTIEACLVIC